MFDPIAVRGGGEGVAVCRLQAHEWNQQRLQRLRAARVEANQRRHAITRQRFWLAMLWASAAQETMGRVCLPHMPPCPAP